MKTILLTYKGFAIYSHWGRQRYYLYIDKNSKTQVFDRLAALIANVNAGV